MRPLKLSQKPFCIGFPGALKCQTTLLSCAQANMAFEVNSVPLSETIMPGLPRRLINAVSSRATRRPKIEGQGSPQALPRHVIDDVDVWMPPFAQDVFERLGRVIGCGHVSGLRRGLSRPLAGMEMRGPGADQDGEL